MIISPKICGEYLKNIPDTQAQVQLDHIDKIKWLHTSKPHIMQL